MRNFRFALLLVAGVATLATMPGAMRLSAQSRGPSVLAITNATVLTVTKGTLTRGTVIVKDGKIAAVGADVAVPPGRRGRRCHRPVRHAGHHRRAFAHRRRFHQRGRHDGELDDRHRGRLQPHRHRHLPRPGRRRHDGQRAARQREPDRRQEPRDQAALGQGADRRVPLRRRAAGHQVRARREPEGHAAVRPAGPAPLSDQPHGRGVRDSRRVHPGPGVSGRVGRLCRHASRRTPPPFRRGAICSSSRWWRCSRASAWSTRTAIAPTRS